MRTLRFCFALILLCAAAQAQETFQLDPSKTDIRFTLHDPLHTVHGTFKLKRGTIQLDSATGKAAGEIVIDTTSGASGNGSRDHRMHKEILESQRYPEAVFTPSRVDGRIAPQGESQVDVQGVFRIHGSDHELTLHFQIQASGGQDSASTHFVIPYVQWGLKNPSNFFLKVDDKVEMDVTAVVAPSGS